MHPKKIGDITEAIVFAPLIKLGRTLLMPFGENNRYDFVIDNKDGTFSRVQCKTGRIRNDAVTFKSCSIQARGERKNYIGQIECFGVYCPENDSVYMVPIADCSITTVSLRLSPCKSGRLKDIKYAVDYLLK
jgi:hypothetical protein